MYSLDVLLSYLEPVHCSRSNSNCCFLTCIQISQEAGKVFWSSHLFKNFPQFVMIHTVKGFILLNKEEVDVSMELSCFFGDPANVGNLISGSSAFSKPSLNIWKFTDHVLLKPGLENFEHYFASVWAECDCVVVWTFFGIAFLWDWNENWLENGWALSSFVPEEGIFGVHPFPLSHKASACLTSIGTGILCSSLFACSHGLK